MESGAGDDMSTEMQTTTQARPAADLFATAMSSWDSALAFAHMMTRASILPVSLVVRTMRPQDEKGKPTGPIDPEATAANVLLIGAHSQALAIPFLTGVQNLHNVHGTVMVSGKLAIGLIRERSQYKDVGWETVKDDVRMYGWMTDRLGEWVRVDGPWINIPQMKSRYGNKPNSAWQTQPDRQAHYCAARAFANLHCPQVLAGMSIDDGTDEHYSEAVIIDEPRRPSSRAVITSATPLALGPAVTTQPAEPAPVADVAPPSEPAVAKVDAPAPVARSAPKGTPLPPIDEMLAALPDRFVGVDERVWDVFSARAVEAVQTAASPDPQSVEAEVFVAAMTKTIGTVYVYHTDPVRWSSGKKRPATPQNLEDELARALGMVDT